jgi:hypothetical protein
MGKMKHKKKKRKGKLEEGGGEAIIWTWRD